MCFSPVNVYATESLSSTPLLGAPLIIKQETIPPLKGIKKREVHMCRCDPVQYDQYCSKYKKPNKNCVFQNGEHEHKSGDPMKDDANHNRHNDKRKKISQTTIKCGSCGKRKRKQHCINEAHCKNKKISATK